MAVTDSAVLSNPQQPGEAVGHIERSAQAPPSCWLLPVLVVSCPPCFHPLPPPQQTSVLFTPEVNHDAYRKPYIYFFAILLEVCRSLSQIKGPSLLGCVQIQTRRWSALDKLQFSSQIINTLYMLLSNYSKVVYLGIYRATQTCNSLPA